MKIFFLTLIPILLVLYSMYKNKKSKIKISVYGISEIIIIIIMFIFIVIGNKISLITDYGELLEGSNIFDDIAFFFTSSKNNIINKHSFGMIQEIILLLIIIIEFYKLYKIGKIFNQHERKKWEAFIPCYNYCIECEIKNIKFNFIIPVLINIATLLLILLYVSLMLIMLIPPRVFP